MKKKKKMIHLIQQMPIELYKNNYEPLILS